VNTKNEDDLDYLDELLTTAPQYRKHQATKEYEGWVGTWESVQDPDAIYVKIDDDVVRFVSPLGASSNS
jgi:hypothetical protein